MSHILPRVTKSPAITGRAISLEILLRHRVDGSTEAELHSVPKGASIRKEAGKRIAVAVHGADYVGKANGYVEQTR